MSICRRLVPFLALKRQSARISAAVAGIYWSAVLFIFFGGGTTGILGDGRRWQVVGELARELLASETVEEAGLEEISAFLPETMVAKARSTVPHAPQKVHAAAGEALRSGHFSCRNAII